MDRIRTGEIRIPAFQRRFVWPPEKVAYLMDSIYKGYPVGTILVWRAKEKLVSERNLGPYKIPEPDDGYPIDYVLDGQQRLTSIFGVFENELVPSDDSRIEWLDIYFDLSKSDNAQDSQFIALKPEDVNPDIHFPMRSIFAPLKFLEETNNFRDSPKTIERLVELSRAFTETQIPLQVVETQEREKIAIIFERINRAGIPLSNFELLSAWTWSDEFDLQEQIANLSDDLDEFGFGEIDRQENIILKLCAAIVEGDTSTRTIMSLNGAEVRKNFDKISNGLKGAIDFLRRNCFVESFAVLPYPTMLVPLAIFFATDSKTGVTPTDEQRRSIIRWFWKSSFNRRYSSSVDTALRTDLILMGKISSSPSEIIDDLILEIIAEFFKLNSFSIKSINTQTFILLLASQRPKSLLNGQDVNLSNVLQTANKNEFHHIYPKAYLKDSGISNRSEQWAIANFCFLSMIDNRRISKKSPTEYIDMMPDVSRNDILISNAIPPQSFGKPFEQFIAERSEYLLGIARGLANQ